MNFFKKKTTKALAGLIIAFILVVIGFISYAKAADDCPGTTIDSGDKTFTTKTVSYSNKNYLKTVNSQITPAKVTINFDTITNVPVDNTPYSTTVTHKLCYFDITTQKDVCIESTTTGTGHSFTNELLELYRTYTYRAVVTVNNVKYTVASDSINFDIKRFAEYEVSLSLNESITAFYWQYWYEGYNNSSLMTLKGNNVTVVTNAGLSDGTMNRLSIPANSWHKITYAENTPHFNAWCNCYYKNIKLYIDGSDSLLGAYGLAYDNTNSNYPNAVNADSSSSVIDNIIPSSRNYTYYYAGNPYSYWPDPAVLIKSNSFTPQYFGF